MALMKMPCAVGTGGGDKVVTGLISFPSGNNQTFTVSGLSDIKTFIWADGLTIPPNDSAMGIATVVEGTLYYSKRCYTQYPNYFEITDITGNVISFNTNAGSAGGGTSYIAVGS